MEEEKVNTDGEQNMRGFGRSVEMGRVSRPGPQWSLGCKYYIYFKSFQVKIFLADIQVYLTGSM